MSDGWAIDYLQFTLSPIVDFAVSPQMDSLYSHFGGCILAMFDVRSFADRLADLVDNFEETGDSIEAFKSLHDFALLNQNMFPYSSRLLCTLYMVKRIGPSISDDNTEARVPLRSLLERAIELDPYDPDPYFEMAKLVYLTDEALSVELYKRSLACEMRLEVVEALCDCLIDRSLIEEASDWIDRGIAFGESQLKRLREIKDRLEYQTGYPFTISPENEPGDG